MVGGKLSIAAIDNTITVSCAHISVSVRSATPRSAVLRSITRSLFFVYFLCFPLQEYCTGTVDYEKESGDGVLIYAKSVPYPAFAPVIL